MDERGRERQRGGVAWALADLDGLLARGVIDTPVYEALRRDYEARMRSLDGVEGAERADELPVAARAAPAATPQGAGTAPGDLAAADTAPLAEGEAAARGREVARGGGPPAAVARPADGEALRSDPPPAPPPAPAGVTGLWINLALFLGAFFVVMASLIFVRSSWRFLGAEARIAI